MTFMQALRERWREADTLVCVGLDPEPARFPRQLANDPDAIFRFCRDIIDTTAEYVCAFKPQFAHFAAAGAEDALARLIAHIHQQHPGVLVILDAKRGDIGSTATHYATEAFDRYGADAVTVHPYLGRDSAQPFLDRADKGVIVLCRTSNPGGADFQNLECEGQPLYLRVAKAVADEWNANGNCALVVGATWPEELGRVRDLVGDMPLLVPGIGAQGGDLAAVLQHGLTNDGGGLIISSSRSINYASNGPSYSDAAAAAARELHDEINRHRRR